MKMSLAAKEIADPLLVTAIKIRMLFKPWKCWSESVADFSSCCRNVPQIIKNHLSDKSECWPSGRKERSENLHNKNFSDGSCRMKSFLFMTPGIDCKPVPGQFAFCYGRHQAYVSQLLVSASNPLKR